MTVSNHYEIVPVLFENINDLCGLLRQSKKEYEQAAAALGDEALSQTILTLAQANNQYACELLSQLQIFGIAAQEEKTQEPEVKAAAGFVGDESALLRFCKRKEKKIVAAYQKLLKKSYLNEEIRNIIRYQLAGMRSAFVQIQLLSSLQSH